MMQNATALQRVADSAVEATCLLAVLALPLYFSILTGGYEPDKAVLVRTLACVAAGAMLVSLAVGWTRRRQGVRETGGPGNGERTERPSEEASHLGLTFTGSNALFALAILVFVAYLVSTILSIDSRLSLWGSEGRQQGLWTRAAYLVFLLAVATSFRTTRQLNRLISRLLLGSLPVVIYAFFQQFGHDVVGSSGSPDTKQWPVWSSFGQHVFFGSYLVMLMPFTLSRLVTSLQSPVSSRQLPVDSRQSAVAVLRWPFFNLAWKDREVWIAAGTIVFVGFGYVAALALGAHQVVLFAILPGLLALYVLLGNVLARVVEVPAVKVMEPASYAALLAAQVLALAFTGARAAWIGALATVPVFGFLAARRLGRPQISRLILAVTIVGTIFLVLLNIPNGPLQPLRTVHGMSRAANITDSGGAEGSAQGRLLLWQGVKKLMTSVPAIGGNWGGIGRDVVGYGPETMSWAFDTTFPLKLRQVNSEILTWDRSHNVYLDYLIDSGFLGLLLLIGVLIAFFWRMLTLLSIVRPRRHEGAERLGFGEDRDRAQSLPRDQLVAFFWRILNLLSIVRPRGHERGERLGFGEDRDRAQSLPRDRLVAFFWRILNLLSIVRPRGHEGAERLGFGEDRDRAQSLRGDRLVGEDRDRAQSLRGDRLVGEDRDRAQSLRGDRAAETRAWILIAAAAAMVGHLVDGFFSIETAVTFLLFWMMVGIAANTLFERPRTVEGVADLEPAVASEGSTTSGRPLLPDSLLGSVVGLSFALVLGGIILVLFATSNHSTVLAVFWLLSILLGLAAITIPLLPHELFLKVGESIPRGHILQPSASPAPLGEGAPPRLSLAFRGKTSSVAFIAIGAVALLAISSQFQYQQAAIAERTGANYLGAGQAGEALPYLQQAIQENGYDAGYQTELAKSYFSLGGSRTDSTEPTFIPSSTDARTIDSFRAESLGQDQLFQLADLSLSSARSLTPLDPDVYNNLGNLYLQWGKPAQAIAEYAQAERLSSNNPRYLDQEALAHLSAKDLTKAAQRAKDALNLDSTFWLSHYTLALVDHQAGDHSGAKQEATLSLDLVGNYWPPPPSSQLQQLQSLKAQG